MSSSAIVSPANTNFLAKKELFFFSSTKPLPSPLSSTISPRSNFLIKLHLGASGHRGEVLNKRNRVRVCISHCSSSNFEQPSTSSSSVIFGGQKELTGFEVLVDKLPPAVRLAASVLIFSGAISAGYGIGLHFGKTRNAMIGGAVALGAIAGAAIYALNSCVPDVASIHLHNYVASCGSPDAVKREEIEKLLKKYGISKQDASFNAEMCDLYSRFVSSMLPSGSEELKGNEFEAILKFKNALGIDDPDAASAHIEIGRRIFRQRLEIGDRGADVDQRRAFQKLVYVSTLVFGEASTFLLPWKRVFKVTDAQVEVAIRDNGQRLYLNTLRSGKKDINIEFLIELREAQMRYRLSDELAGDLFREHVRKLVENNVSTALSVLKPRARSLRGVAQTTTKAVEELNKILSFNNMLVSIKDGHPDANKLACGLGPVSLIGGEYGGEKRIDDLKLLYRAYAASSLSNGSLEDDKVAALHQLRNILGLGDREAETVLFDVTSKAYRKWLSQSLSGGLLDAASSKAAFLQNLCDKLRFDPEKASVIHEEIYRQKLQQSVEKGELKEDDVSALVRLRVNLCIPQKAVETAHSEICGTIFEKVVTDAIASDVEGFDEDIRVSVRKTARGLRLTREIAMSTANKAARKMFTIFVKRAWAAENRTESAKELKSMLAFNSLVITRLLADINGEKSAEAGEPRGEEDDEWAALESLRKVRENSVSSTPFQTEITLRDDLPARQRTDLYKTYLLYCLTGEESEVGFGVPVKIQTDDSEYMYLNQLGRLVGLTRGEIVDVHRSLAEQAFRREAEIILSDGQLTKGRIAQLNRAQNQIGLPEKYAHAVIMSITTTKMAAALEKAVSSGKLSIKEVRELKDSGVDLESMISPTLCENLFRRTVEGIFSSGKGEFDEDEVYRRIPSDLNIDAEKAKRAVHELARSRISNSIIEAVSVLRQRNYSGVVASLNNMLTCDEALPSERMKWDVQDELTDLFAVYMSRNPDSDKLSRLQRLLGVSDSTVASLREVGTEALIDRVEEEEEFVF